MRAVLVLSRFSMFFDTWQLFVIVLLLLSQELLDVNRDGMARLKRALAVLRQHAAGRPNFWLRSTDCERASRVASRNVRFRQQLAIDQVRRVLLLSDARAKLLFALQGTEQV